MPAYNVLTLNIRYFVRNYAKRSLTVSAFHVEGILQNDKKNVSVYYN